MTTAELKARIVELETQLTEALAKHAGADQVAAAAQLERDAARLALDASLAEPCTVCGTRRVSTP